MLSSLQWRRIGILAVNTLESESTRRTFQEACAPLGVEITAVETFPAGVNLSSFRSQETLAFGGRKVARAFQDANVQVVLIIAPGPDFYTALSLANRSGMSGSGYAMVFPSIESQILITPPTTHVERELLRLAHGSLGVVPVTYPDSPMSNRLWIRWPKNRAQWAALLGVSGQSRRTSALPTFARNALTEASFYVYDGTLLAARAAAQAWRACGMPAGHIPAGCLVPHVRNATVQGSSGQVGLDNHGNRVGGAYSIYNFLWNGTDIVRARRGEVDMTSITVDTETVVWSDNSTNRTEPPDLTDTRFMAETTMQTQVNGMEDSPDVRLAVPLGIGGAALVIALIGAIIVCHRTHLRDKNGPADFHEVIHCMVEQGTAVDFTLPPPPNEHASHARADSPMPSGALDLSNRSHETQSRVGGSLNVPRELNREDVVLDDVLGEGHFGQVYRGMLARISVEDASQRQITVAVKTAHSANESPDIHREFLEEAALTWQVSQYLQSR